MTRRPILPAARPAARAAARALALGLACAAAGAVLAAPAAPAAAQEIVGMVVDDLDRRPLDGAVVSLRDTTGVAHASGATDEEGRFRLVAPHVGPWLLAVERPGYRPLAAQAVRLPSRGALEVVVTLAVDAIPLEPLTIVARRGGAAFHQGFYDRMERGRRSGMGHFISREDAARSGSFRPSDLLRGVAGVHIESGRGSRGAIVRMRGGCVPALFIDGAHINRIDLRESLDSYLAVLDIEGIEVYRGPAAQVDRFRDARGCGTILVWTRIGPADEDVTDTRWTTRAIIVGIIAAVFLLLN